MYGCTASALILFSTGIITNSERNSARPTSTVFGGDCCVPRALRSSPSTMTMRVNGVTMTTMVGARVISVKSSMIWISVAASPPVPPTLKLTFGSARAPGLAVLRSAPWRRPKRRAS